MFFFFLCVFCVFYFIKISKFALPGVMLIYERTSKDRKKERHVERVLVCPHCKKTPVRLCAGEGGGYSYIFIHMLLESFFGFKILNSNIFGGFQKK